MPADDDLRALMFGVRNHGIFKRANEADRLLYHRLGRGGERPVRQSQYLPDEIEMAVDEHRKFVGPVAKMREPFDIAHDRVELVAMEYQGFATIDQLVGRFFHDVD